MAKSAFIVNPKNKETLHPPGRFGFLRRTRPDAKCIAVYAPKFGFPYAETKFVLALHLRSAFLTEPVRSVLLILNFTIDYAPFPFQNRIFNYKGILKVSFYYRVWYTLW